MFKYICTQCSYRGQRVKKKPGTAFMEILLWSSLLVPIALPYSIWRHVMGSNRKVCPICGSPNMLPERDGLSSDKSGGDNSPISQSELEAMPSMWKDDVRRYNLEHGITTPVKQEKNVEQQPITQKDTELNKIIERDNNKDEW